MSRPIDLTPSPALVVRRRRDRLFHAFAFAGALLCLVVLALLLFDIVSTGAARLSWEFINSFPSRFADRAGVRAALWGSAWLMIVTMAIAGPIGVAAAIYLEEFTRRGRLAAILEINISNLAGVPSIIYGILGLAFFVRWLALGRSILAGALTMALLVLPVVIIATREALRAVPGSLRAASFALGASPLQTVLRVVLPSAMPGIVTGLILALSRAIGETAPLIMIGALTYVAFVPQGPMDSFTALPIQIFDWASRPQAAFQQNAAAGILVLLALLLVMNSIGILIRQRASRKLQP
ncbi:MAG: phosphate ABC transporter permease PstA [Candidatus Sumerlaeia bacterium]|nr:phosphate ABC transporter permease PstA [Candidatus Sumerlaeia bacterium]